MRRLVTMGAAISMAALVIGCVPVDPAPTTTTGAPPTTSPIDLNACEIERSTIQLALEAYKVTESHFPETLLDLVTAGWLENPPSFDWLYVTDGATYSLDGPC